MTHAEQPDWTALATYLRAHLTPEAAPGLDLTGPFEIEQCPGGHSNLTYLARFGNTELVIRRPPVGPVPPKAHDIAREFRWLAAIHRVFRLAPRPYLLCDDVDVLGSVFSVMECRRGIVIRREEPPEFAGNPSLRGQASAALVDALIGLHAVDVSRQPLASLGKPSGFVQRQIHGWNERWKRSKLTEVPEMDALARWLTERVPPESEATIVHGDFKLDNVLFDATAWTRLVGVLDWEMVALGSPLVDLGILLAYWAPAAPSAQRDALTSVTDRRGWFTRDQIIERYALRSGRDVSNVRFFETFALFKIAVVLQQIFFRFKRGQTDDPRFAGFGERVSSLARRAIERTR